MAKKVYNEYDYACAVGRLRALENHLLTAGDFEKLLAAPNTEEAVNALISFGFEAADSFEEMIEKEVSNVFSLIESLGGREFLKTQRVKYDYHNLKVLTLAQLTKQNGDGLLIDLGNISVSTLKNAVISRDYRELYENMRSAVEGAYDVYARLKDPQLVDIVFDRAMFFDLLDYAKDLPEEKIQSLIKFQIDMHNIKAFIRVRRMKKEYGFIEKVIAFGGTISPDFYINNINAPDEAGLFERTPFARAFNEGKSLEMNLDNMFMEKVKALKSGAFGMAPLAAYFFMKENEIRNVRIILTCKNAGIDEEAICNRLRGFTNA